jgi:hypothetical protein
VKRALFVLTNQRHEWTRRCGIFHLERIYDASSLAMSCLKLDDS